MDREVGWPTAVVALGFLVLVGVMFWRSTADPAMFTSTWVAVGPIVGVVVGVLPGAFFGVQARSSERKAVARAEYYAGQLPPERAIESVHTADPFR